MNIPCISHESHEIWPSSFQASQPLNLSGAGAPSESERSLKMPAPPLQQRHQRRSGSTAAAGHRKAGDLSTKTEGNLAQSIHG